MLRRTPLGSTDPATYIALNDAPKSGGAQAHPESFATFLPQVEMAFNAWPVILCRLPGIVKLIKD
jgi:hypothetical protein